jgi:hypothetical protein
MEPWEKIAEFVDIANEQLGKYKHVSWDIIVYNRGVADYESCVELAKHAHVTIVTSRNVGRETYVVHHYITEHYNNLPEVVFFLPAHWWGPLRKHYVQQIFKNMFSHHFCPKPSPVPWKTERFFTLDAWGGSPVNSEGVASQKYKLASIRPFGDWFAARIPVKYKNKITFAGTFSCHRKQILKYPLEMYQIWLAEIKHCGPNGEICHFWERSFYSLLS